MAVISQVIVPSWSFSWQLPLSTACLQQARLRHQFEEGFNALGGLALAWPVSWLPHSSSARCSLLRVGALFKMAAPTPAWRDH